MSNTITNKDYIEYLEEIDEILLNIYGKTHNLLSDYDWFDAFNDGLTPNQAVIDYQETRVLSG